MKITDKSVVELIYELEVEGQVVDHTTEERPLDYIHGTHSLIPGFEAATKGLEPGDAFDFVLQPEEAYGPVDPARIIDLPIEIFTDHDGNRIEEFLKIGATVPLVNGNGQMVPGKVLEVGEKVVKVDLNSSMAGKTLHFTGKILSVREATPEELHDGLHGEFVRSNCKGGCGHCGGHHGEGHCGGGCHGEEGGCGHCKE